jgi:ferredoxin-NADP reductase
MSPIVIVAAVVVVLAALAFFLTRSRGGAGPRAQAPAALRWKVTRLVRETPSTVSFEVDGTLDFKPGQFVLLRPKPELPWRAYSFSRAPGDALRLTVKHVPGGQVSSHVTQALKEGDALEVKGPYGQFVLPPHATRAIFVAGGSGVTPFVSMLHALAKQGWPTQVLMVDAHRSAEEQILKAELEALAQGSGGKFELIQLLDDGAGAQRGPPTREVLAKLFEGREKPDVVATCGPQPMMDGVREVATARWPGVAVLEEKFSAAPEASGSGAAVDVEVVMDGKGRTFPVHQGEHVLAAARAAKIGLSAGCEMGACGVCRVKLLSGDIEVPEDSCLSDEERAQGYRLVCVGKVTQAGCRFEPAP